jgi:hypothetical protein
MVNVWGLIDDVQDTSRLMKGKGLDDDWREKILGRSFTRRL